MSTDRLMAETFRNLTFWKMTGSGNDFVFFDGRQIDASLLTLPEVKFRLACFHAQQAVEKLLKAVLVFYNIDYQRTHDLH